MTTEALKGTTEASGQAIKLVRRLAAINMALVALQAISAGFSLSGYADAVRVHVVVAFALEFGAFAQAVTALVLWRQRRVPAWVAGLSIGLFGIVFLQLGLGYRRSFWLHVPLGVGIFGGLTRQVNRLDTLSPQDFRSAE